MRTSVQDRLVGAIGAGIVVALLGWMLIAGLSVQFRARAETLMTLLDLAPPPPPPPRPRPHLDRPTPRHASGKASPRNLRNKATEIVSPPPIVPPPIPPPIVAATHQGVGMAMQTGASDRPGPGEGAGGAGNGTGSGDYGDGDGGGDVPPRQIGGRLKPSDLPPDLRETRTGGTVSVRYSVEVDGHVGDCRITGASGSAELDELTCRLILQRFRFVPSRDGVGRPVRSEIEERHSWIVDPATDPPDN